MPQERRRPPTRDRRRFGNVLLGQQFDRSENSQSQGAPQGQHLTRSTESGISYLSRATGYDFIPPNWRRLGFVLGQVFEDWSKDWDGTDDDRYHIARRRKGVTHRKEHRP